MSDIKKTKQKIKKDKGVEPFIFIPENVEGNNTNIPLDSPLTEYKNRRCSIGRDAYRQVTGK